MFVKGSRIGEYEVIEDSRIDQGSGTHIYKVKRITDGNIYALKVIKPDILEKNQDKIIRQLTRDYTVLERLDHPNIIKPVAGILQEPYRGSLYIVLEYFDGQPISTLASQTSRNAFLVAEAFAQCAEAFAYAHSKGVYHGDVAAKNILVRKTNSGGIEVKILDFGLARIDEYLRRSAQESTILQPGTLAYAAPERILDDKPPAAASDIYSLGMVLYEVLHGRLPFTKDISITAITRFHTTKKIPPHPLSSLSAPSDVERGLSHVAMRALSRRPWLRYWTMQSMHKALGKAQRGEISDVSVWLQHHQNIWINILSGGLAFFAANALEEFNRQFGPTLPSILNIGAVGLLLYLVGIGFASFIRTTARTGLWVAVLSIIAICIILFGAPAIASVFPNELFPTPSPSNQASPNPVAERLSTNTPTVTFTLSPTVTITSSPTTTPTNTATVTNTSVPPTNTIIQPSITPEPTVRPTARPTVRPTPQPTIRPTPQPTVRPTPQPTSQPAQPTVQAEQTNWDGNWQGSTSVGGTINFTVLNRNVTSIEFAYPAGPSPSLIGDCTGVTERNTGYSSTITQLKIRINDSGAFSSTRIPVRHEGETRFVTISGVLGTGNSASGEFLEDNPDSQVPSCTHRANFSWTANK